MNYLKRNFWSIFTLLLAVFYGCFPIFAFELEKQNVDLPTWEIGDWWITANLGESQVSSTRETMPLFYLYSKVVAEQEIDNTNYFIVEEWPSPINPAFPELHKVYYFRASDMALVRQIEYYYSSNVLQPPFKKDFNQTNGIPYFDGTFSFPIFPITEGIIESILLKPSKNEGDNQSPIQKNEPVDGFYIDELINPLLSQLPKPPDFIKSIGDNYMEVEIISVGYGTDESNRPFSKQIWGNEFPWYLYSEEGHGTHITSQSLLFDFGSKDNSPTTLDKEYELDTSPFASFLKSNNEMTLNQDRTTESASVSEPWSGCWWSMLGTSTRANLFDTGSPDTWRPLRRYDENFALSPTSVSWESSAPPPNGHCTTSPDNFWFGHCHAWAAASIVESKPTSDRSPFLKGDLEGLLTECWYNITPLNFRPTGGDNDDNIPMTPGTFWIALRENIQNSHRAVVMDLYSKTSGIDQVWNHPIYYYLVDYSVSQGKASGTFTITYELDEANPTSNLNSHMSRTYTFNNVTFSGGSPSDGTGNWLSSSYENQYPDVAWYPGSHSTGNPYINEQRVRGLITLNPPSGLTVSSKTQTYVTLGWQDNSSGESGFRPEIRVGTSGTWTETGPVGANVTSCGMIDCSPGTSYYFRIRAYNSSGGYSVYSNVVNTTTDPTVSLTVNGSTVSGNINPAKDKDWYRFVASTSATYTIETWAGSLTDNYMYLYGPNSMTVFREEDDDDGTGNMAKIVRSLSSGTYYVKIKAWDPNVTGTYTIRVTR